MRVDICARWACVECTITIHDASQRFGFDPTDVPNFFPSLVLDHDGVGVVLVGRLAEEEYDITARRNTGVVTEWECALAVCYRYYCHFGKGMELLR